MIRPSTFSGLIRSVTTARAAISARGLLTVIQPPSSMPRSRASSGSISANIAGCSSSSHGTHRDIPPAVWCSVNRKVVATHGKRWSPMGAFGFSGRSHCSIAGFDSRSG